MPQGQDSGISFNQDLVGVVVEAGTFPRSVDLSISLLAKGEERPLSEALSLDAKEKPPVVYNEGHTALAFELGIVDAASGKGLAAFDKPVRLAIDLRLLGLAVPEGMSFFLAYQDEDNPAEWTEVPLTVHQPDGFFSAEVSHFSSWTTGWRPDGWTLAWEPPSANGFSGASTYQYAFQVPPGRNGLQPTLGLSYANSALNGAVRRVNKGTVAAGWSLSQMAVVRTGVKLSSELTSLEKPETFRLLLNGAGHHLEISDPVEQNGSGGDRYYAKDAPQLRIWRYEDPGYWMVQGSDGTAYRLGYTSSSRSWHKLALNEHLGSGGTYDEVVIEWHVDTLTDTFGNQIRYDHDNSVVTEFSEIIGTCFWNGGFCVVRLRDYSSRVTDIYYNFAGRVYTLPPTRLMARLDPSPTADNAASHIAFDYGADNNTRLSKITVSHNGQAMREYELVAENKSVTNPGCPDGSSTRTSTTRVLNSVVEYGWDGATGQRFSLPAVKFEYENRANFLDGGDPCFIFKHLAKVTNGYGAEVVFGYASDGRSVGNYENTGSGAIEYPDIGYSHYVASVVQGDGIAGDREIQYERSGACYNQSEWNGTPCPLENPPKYGPLAGFSDVVSRYYDFDGGTVLKKEIARYHQDIENFGKPEWYETWEGNGATRLQKTSYTYHTTLSNGSTSFAPIQEEKGCTYLSGQELCSWSHYSYDPAWQGGLQHGNVTSIKEYDTNHPSAYFREKLTIFHPRTGGWYWIVDKPSNISLTDGAGEMVAGTFLYYDNETDNTYPPTQGALNRVDQLSAVDCDEVPGSDGSGCLDDRAYQLTVQRHTYDDYGNQTGATTFTDYGYQAFDAGWERVVDSQPGQGRTTTFAYEPDFHLYPVSMTDPVSHTITAEFYGFNGVALDGFQSHSGLLKKVTGANGVARLYEYDPFGRLHAVYEDQAEQDGLADPWDGNPLKRYRYWDNDWKGFWYGPLDPASLPGSGEVQAQATFSTGTTYTESVWQNNQVYRRSAPIVDGQIRWEQLSGWSAAVTFNSYVGVSESCTIQSHGAYVLGDTLVEGLWCGNLGRHRYVPVVSGEVQWNNPGSWSAPYPVSVLEGEGDILAQGVLVENDLLVEGFWREDGGYSHTIPIVDGELQFSLATPWVFIPAGTLPGSGEIQAQTADATTDFRTEGVWQSGVEGYVRSHPLVDGHVDWSLPYRFFISEQTRPEAYPAPAGTTFNLRSTLDRESVYDGFGRLVQQKERYHNVDGYEPGTRDIVTVTAYDALGRVACAAAPFVAGRELNGDGYACLDWDHTASTYDVLGRPLTVTAPDGTETVVEHAITTDVVVHGQSRLRREGRVDPKGHRVENYYDSQGQLLLVREFTGQDAQSWQVYAGTAYDYDLAGNLVGVVDGAGNSTTMAYDGFGRKVSMDDPDMGDWTYVYDGAGNLVRQEDGAGQAICFYYDALDRLVRKVEDGTPGDGACPAYNEAPASGPLHLASYVYDIAPNGVGQLGQVNWGDEPGDNGDTFLYDDHGRVISQTRTIDGRGFTLLTLSFDSLDRPLTVRYPDGETISMTYDREGVDVLEAGGDTLVNGLAHNERGQMTGLAYGNDVDMANSYFGSGGNFRLQTAATSHGSTPLLEYGYAYDLVGNVTAITETVSGDNQAFTYDTLNRLTAATGSGSYGYNHTYGYDAIGNMTENAGVEYGYEDDTHVHAVTDLDGVEKFQYDGNGNMISRVDGATTYEQGFDVENHLVVVTNTNTLSVTQFAYDAGGQRVKTVEPDGSIIYTPFPNYEETVGGSSTTVRAYYLLGGQAIAMRVSSDPAGPEDGLYYIHADHLGSTTLLTDESGGVVGGPTRYYPYGDYRGTPGTGVTDRGFTGHRENRSLGLIYMNARYYLVGTGRFASADTIVPDPVLPQALNRYSYSLQNPIKYTDPTGHYVCKTSDSPCLPPPDAPNVIPRESWEVTPSEILDLPTFPYRFIGRNEGYYHPERNEAGYASYAELEPGSSLSEVLSSVIIHHEGNGQTLNAYVVLAQHMIVNGWVDTGYHFIVAPDGTIYEGRSLEVRGAHVIGENTGRIGVLLLGDFEPGPNVQVFGVNIFSDRDNTPTELQIAATVDLVEWLDYWYGIDAVVGHSDVPGQSTECPGDYCLPYIPVFNAAVQRYE